MAPDTTTRLARLGDLAYRRRGRIVLAWMQIFGRANWWIPAG
jgi:hypothetical protein